MASPEEQRMDALTDALARLVRWQQQVDRRLDRIEQELHIARTAEPVPEPPSAAARGFEPPAAGIPPAPPASASAAPPAREVRAFESRMGLVWLNRAGVITLVLGVAFFFKLAVDNRWIGEWGRVALGVAAGLIALGAADRLWRRDQKTFAQGICGAGIAILYIAFYASFGFYRLIPQGLAFVLMALITAAAGALALRYGSAAIAALGLAGGYLTPVVLSTGENRPWAFLGYVLVLSAGAVAVARMRRWRGIAIFAFLATTALYWSWLFEYAKESRTPANLFALAYYALFAWSPPAALAAVNQLVANISVTAAGIPDAIPYLPLAILLAAGALAMADQKNQRWMPLAALASFWVPYATAHFELKRHNPPEVIFSFVTLAFLLFFAWAPWRALVRNAGGERRDLLLVTLNAAAYFSAGYDLLDPAYHVYMGLFAAALSLLHLGAAREIRADSREAALYAGVALCFTTLAVPIQFTGFRITMAWALEAAALAWIANRTAARRLSWAALAVAALVVIRLVAVDSRMYAVPELQPVLWNARLLTFLTAAAAVWLTAFWASARAAALAAYVGGHFVLLWGLALEVLAWASRRASAPDLPMMRSTSVSILLAAYAVALVAIGVWRRSPLDRILGLGLIAAVVLKLYLYDVWNISRGVYRVAAFAGLGAFLLITSYLYSRYRGSIESWWRREGESAAGPPRPSI